MRDNAKVLVRQVGLPRIIIAGFFLLLLVAAGGFQMDLLQLCSDFLRRWGMYGVLALAMVPAVQCGIGLNFGISMGIVGGLLGGLIVIEFRLASIPALVAVHPLLAQWVGILIAILIGVVLATGIGWLYGLLLNRVKGSEMTVTTYVGFSIIAFMNILWTILPFQSGELIYPNAGQGLRNTISLADSYSGVMNNTFAITIGSLTIPTGLLLFFFLMCLLVWLFMRSKTGEAMSAAGANPNFARANGINVNRMRLVGTILSTVLAAVGILVYAQGFGFMQLYNGPMMMGFTSVAAVLIGGASPRKARISHVLIGTFLFQSIMALALPVANQFIPESNLSEVMRLIISNGIIIYALTQTGGGDRE
ncbi:ABC transporter permease subunit [Angelakisella massiliensis]|uniref:ABC transporter permease subunit n=1 Tax=Angelakisella massiliensis TaxID=1871018 RepID=UPI0023A90F38|nr:ABC transporter permease [Angelakisella massiliensis]